jgi:hypothetical protein
MKRREFLSATAGAAAAASACLCCARGSPERLNIRSAPAIFEIAGGRAPDSMQRVEALNPILSGQTETKLRFPSVVNDLFGHN